MTLNFKIMEIDVIQKVFEEECKNLDFDEVKIFLEEGKSALEAVESINNEETLQKLQKDLRQKKGYQTVKKEENNDSLESINKFVAYCDYNATKKNKKGELYNSTGLVMAKTIIWQPNWINSLAQYALDRNLDNITAYGVKKAIQYFKDPDKLMPITSERHRKLISKYFLGEEDVECDGKLIDKFNICLNEKVADITNQANKNYLYNRIIYAMREEWDENKLVYDVFDILLQCKNIILTGAPGTGKTFLARENIANLKDDNENKFFDKIEFVQFHPTYDYTDFVEGLRPITDSNKNIVFERKDGIFKRFCKCAILGLPVDASDKDINDKNKKEGKYKDKKYLFIIDEINRGDISKIFGELFFAIDPGYRGERGRVDTQYQNLVSKEDDDIFKDGFYIPDNVYIIGTMNDIDRSVESLDFAFRRRFAFKEISVRDTQKAILNSIGEDYNEVTKRMDAINNKLKDFGLSEAYYIGAAYFAKIKNYSRQTKNKFESLWDYHLKGVLYEYFRGESDADKKLKELKKVYDEAKSQG